MSLNDDLNTLLAPPGQFYYGSVYDQDPISRDLAQTGQLNPIVEREFKSQEGHYLSGVENMDSGESVVERAEHQEVYDAEEQDDVLGSGIFDPSRRPGTSNTNMGVLASRYSLPGYVAREVPFTTSRDVTDLTDNASVVVVPGGGMAYVEAYGRLVGPASLGPQPQPPRLRPAPPTSRDQGYVSLTENPTRGWDADALLNQVERPFNGLGQVVSPSPMQPESPQAPRLAVRDVDDTRALSRYDVPPPNVPAFPYAQGSPSLYTPPPAHPARAPFFQVQTVPTWPATQRVPTSPRYSTVPTRSYVNPIGARISMGQEPEPAPTTWFAYAVAGVVAGVALKMLYGVTK